MKKCLYIFTVLIILTHCSIGQIFDPALSTKLQNNLDSMRTAYNIKGISASVFYPGQGIWKGTSGVSYGTVPITPDMEFGIGSNTKTFTAVTLLKLAEYNIIFIDDSLHEWLPHFNNVDSTIMIRQILNHTSGIEDITNVTGYVDSILSDPDRIFTPDEVMTWVGPPLFPAGTDWSYSNTNYILAGMIAESATNQNIEKFIRDSILIPLQLDSTFFPVEDTILGTIAHPWQNGIDINSTSRTSLNSVAWASGAMYSTSGEMAQWYQALMNGQLINTNSFNEMTTFVGSGNYGFGISKKTIGDRICYGHAGSIRGYQSFILYDTTIQAIVCVLINANPSPVVLVAEQLLLTLVNNPMFVTENLITKNSIIIYPNPTTGILTIEGENIQFIEITNINGQIVYSFDDLKSSDEYQVDLSEQLKGIYFVKIKSNDFIIVKKIVIQ